MDIDFPSSREEYLSRNSNYASSTNSSSHHQNNNNNNDVVEKESIRSSLASVVTSTSSRYEGGGSVLWPSTDEEGNKKKSHHKKRRRRRKSMTTDDSSPQQQQEQQPRRRPTAESSHSSNNNNNNNNNYEVGAGQIAVDFPTDRTPFLRRSSVDDYSSPSAGGGGGGIILDQSLNVIVTEGMKEQQKFPSSRRLSHTSSLSGASHSSSNGGGSKTTMNIDRRAGLIKRRSSLSSMGSSSYGHRSSNESSLNSHRRRRSSLSSATGYDSNDSSGEALNAFSHTHNRRHRKPGDLTRSLDTIHSEASVTQSLREKELRQSLRASLLRRNKSMSNVDRRRSSSGERRRPSNESRTSMGSLERRPSMRSIERQSSKGSLERRPSIGDLLEAEQKQTKSLVAAHNATVLALPIVGWDVEKQSDNSSFLGSSGGRDDQQSKYTSNSMGLQRSFRRASFTESMSRSSMRSYDFADHSSIPTSLISSLNNNSADNPNPNGQFLCEEFVSRETFQRNTNLPIVDEKSGNNSGGGAAAVAVEQLIMEEEYDPRKPWRKAPAVSFPNRRASNATFSLTSSLNLDEFQTSMDSQQLIINKEMEADEEVGGDQQQQQQVDDDTDQDKLMRSSRSSQSRKSGQEPPVEETAAAAAQVVNEVPSDSHMEDASSSTARRTPKADESTVLSSLAVDDDDSELTELRHAQEALFPIQEGGFKEKLNEGYEMNVSDHRYSEQSDGVSGASFGVDALENSDHPLDGSDRKVAHRNDYSLHIVQEEDEQIVQEKILQKKQQQEQQRVDEIIWEQEQLQKQQNPGPEGLKREGSRRTLSSDDLGANQIRRDLQLDDLPSSAGDIYEREKKSLDDNDAFSEDVEPKVSSAMTRVCINYTDESIENEFATTMLEDVEFGRRESELYEEENDLDVSELGRLFEATRNDDILKDDSSSKRSGSGLTSSKGNGSGSRKTSSTLESAMKPIKSAMKKSASSLDSKATSNIRRRNKRLWKFCVWNCRKITMCVILVIGVLAAIGVLTWLGIVKNRQIKNPGEDGTADIDTLTKMSDNGNGLEKVEPLAAESAFITRPLVKGSTQPPSSSPSQSSSQPSTPNIIQDELGTLETYPVNDTSASTSENETDADTGVFAALSVFESSEPVRFPTTVPSIVPAIASTVPSVSPTVASTPFFYPTNPPISINMPVVETDIIGVMTFSEAVPQDTEEILIIFLDALKKSIRSVVSPSLYTADQLRYVEIISINGEAVDSLLFRRRRLRRRLQTGSSVAFTIVILTECDSSVCADVDAVADDVFSRVKTEMTTSVSSGDFASTLKVATVYASGGTLEYVTAVELGDFPEPIVSFLSSMEESNQANETSANTTTPIDVDDNSTSNEAYFSTLVGNETTSTDGTALVDVDSKSNETNLTFIFNTTIANTANEITATNETSIMVGSIEDGNQIFITNVTIVDINLTLNSVLTSDDNSTITLGDNESPTGLVPNQTLSNFTSHSHEEIESLSAESGNNTTILFNISALDALFNPTLVANETVSASFVNATLSSAADSLTSDPEDVSANVETSATFDSTTFNATSIANETFLVSSMNGTLSNTTEESLTTSTVNDGLENMETSATDTSTTLNITVSV